MYPKSFEIDVIWTLLHHECFYQMSGTFNDKDFLFKRNFHFVFDVSFSSPFLFYIIRIIAYVICCCVVVRSSFLSVPLTHIRETRF